jgi:amino acid transporter
VGSDAGGARPEWIGSAAILVVGLMHGLRLREGVVLQNLAVGLKLLAIALLVAFGASRLPAPGLEANETASFELGAFAVTLVWISFAYSGWNATVYVAGEVRNPERNLHRSLVLATLLVFVFGAPASAIAGKAEVGAIAAEALGGPGLRRAVSVLVALALFTSISAMVMAGPRVYARMAEDGLFPRVFRPGQEVPGKAVALQAGLAILVVWYSDLARLLGYIGFTLGLSAAATVCGLIVLRIREGRARVPIPGYPWIPGLFVVVTLCTAGFMIARQPGEALAGLLTIGAGALLYFAISTRRS